MLAVLGCVLALLLDGSVSSIGCVWALLVCRFACRFVVLGVLLLADVFGFC